MEQSTKQSTSQVHVVSVVCGRVGRSDGTRQEKPRRGKASEKYLDTYVSICAVCTLHSTVCLFERERANRVTCRAIENWLDPFVLNDVLYLYGCEKGDEMRSSLGTTFVIPFREILGIL